MLRREEIYERVWGYAMAHGDRSVDVFVRKLRQKLRVGSPEWSYIHTHFGVGYRFAPEREGGVEAELDLISSEPTAESASTRRSPADRRSGSVAIPGLPSGCRQPAFTTQSHARHELDNASGATPRSIGGDVAGRSGTARRSWRSGRCRSSPTSTWRGPRAAR